MKILSFLFVFLFLSLTGKAQVDSCFIESFPHKIAGSFYLSNSFLSLAQELGKNKEKQYEPNNPMDIGFGFSWKNSALNISYGYGFNFTRDKKKGKTKSFDIQFHNYGRKIVWDIFIQNYKGFYIEDKKGNFIALSPDLSMYKYGIYGEYIINNSQFSYKAAFNMNEKQKISVGSLLLGAGIYFTSVSSDSTFTYDDKNSLHNFQFGISTGYAYSWVINSHWFLTGAISIGLNLGNEKISQLGKKKLEIYPALFPRFSIGYHHEKWSTGFTYMSNVQTIYSKENYNINLISGTLQLLFTRRF